MKKYDTGKLENWPRRLACAMRFTLFNASFTRARIAEILFLTNMFEASVLDWTARTSVSSWDISFWSLESFGTFCPISLAMTNWWPHISWTVSNMFFWSDWVWSTIDLTVRMTDKSSTKGSFPRDTTASTSFPIKDGNEVSNLPIDSLIESWMVVRMSPMSAPCPKI